MVETPPMTARDDILAAIRAARPLQDPPPAPAASYRGTLNLSQDALAGGLAAG